MFLSNQIRSLDHATQGFKLNGIVKKSTSLQKDYNQ